MLANNSPAETKAWRNLTAHFLEMQAVHMRELFQEDPDRFNKLHIQFEDILIDYSKNIITTDTIKLLGDLADEQKLQDAIKQMFEGVAINATEGRAVLHTALRNRTNQPVLVGGMDVMPEINRVLSQMKTFSTN